MVLAWLGVVLLYMYIILAAMFFHTAILIAYEHYKSITFAMTVVTGLWMWIPGIYVYCDHLLFGYMTGLVPTTIGALVFLEHITFPSYPWLWAILIIWQLWQLMISGSCSIAIAVTAAGAMGSITIVVAPWIVLLLFSVCVLIAS